MSGCKTSNFLALLKHSKTAPSSVGATVVAMAPEGHIRVGALEAGLAMFRIDKNPRHFHWHNDVNSFYDDHFWLYMTAAVCYLPLAFGVQRFLRDRKAVNVPSWMLFAWNGLWSVFSGLCFFDILRIVVASDFTWNHSICTDEEFLGELANRPIAQVAMRARFLFIIAKLAELGDTVFIVLRKRPLIVLHYWHHETVMVFCWQVCASSQPRVSTPSAHRHVRSTPPHTRLHPLRHRQLVYVLPRGGDGTYYALMNSFVHMVMYGYYAVTVYWKAIRKVRAARVTSPKSHLRAGASPKPRPGCSRDSRGRGCSVAIRHRLVTPEPSHTAAPHPLAAGARPPVDDHGAPDHPDDLRHRAAHLPHSALLLA